MSERWAIYPVPQPRRVDVPRPQIKLPFPDTVVTLVWSGVIQPVLQPDPITVPASKLVNAPIFETTSNAVLRGLPQDPFGVVPKTAFYPAKAEVTSSAVYRGVARDPF